MIKFNNAILNELSLEGKRYLGNHLQAFLRTIPKSERSKAFVGLKISINNPQIISNSLTDLYNTNLIKNRLNCSLMFCVTLNNEIVEEFEIMPQHLNIEAFQHLERTLQNYNMYWLGSSMFVIDE